MKKIFTLFAVAAMAFTAYAQDNIYKSTAEGTTAGQVLVDNDLLTVTAFAQAKGGEEAKTICGVDFDGWFQFRTDNPDPTVEAPTPGVNSGSTGLSVVAKSSIDLSFYYRRQKGSTGAHVAGDNKDVLCMNTTTGEAVIDVITLNDEAEATESYAFVKGTFSLAPGTYTLYRRGSTMRVFGFTWEAGSQSGIADITVDENAPVEYFNLQGIRVANPENGLYIRRQGNKVEKVYVK